MSTVGQFITKFSSVAKSTTGFLIVVLTSALNQVLARNFFKCPQQAHREYGLCFMIVPALALAILMIMTTFGNSKAIAGVCRKDKDAPKSAKMGKRNRTWRFIFMKLFLALGHSLIAFTCWIIVTFLTTDTYSCVKIGPMPKNKTAVAAYLLEKEKTDAHSKVFGLYLLIACLFSAMMIYFVMKCYYEDPAEKLLPGTLRYHELEALAANEVFTEYLEQAAKANGRKIAEEALEQIKHHPSQSLDILLKPRGFLAMRYPRLDNKENVMIPFLRPEITLDRYAQDMCDGPNPSFEAQNGDLAQSGPEAQGNEVQHSPVIIVQDNGRSIRLQNLDKNFINTAVVRERYED